VGTMSSGLLTSGSLFVLNVHVCQQWEESPEVVFLHRQTLEMFKGL
jgi:hypothetical protein